MKISKILFLLAFSCLSTFGCTTYTPEMGRDERIVARYEQNFRTGPNDPEAGAKRSRRIAADVCTLGLAELWFQHVRASYADWREWNDFVKSLVGRPFSEVSQKFGPPTRQVNIGGGKSMQVYSTSRTITWGSMNSWGTMNMESQEINRSWWLVVDENFIVVDVKRNW